MIKDKTIGCNRMLDPNVGPSKKRNRMATFFYFNLKVMDTGL